MTDEWKPQTNPLLRIAIRLDADEPGIKYVKSMVLAVKVKDDVLSYLTINGLEISSKNRICAFAEAFVNGEWVS
ncbi:hypothetical protein UFOVP1219_24 [uncultured Caudovirales phage]|uniref:Uncharacterized protein n=1 Tax=uncultured Caudovirales phage TaxID=2100421 RepID=A0A6J5T9B7_9CAUD|nr:hypothetical protein UFOVP476_70 [uncultured Caudovirales phage]CAB4176043.1 hypothetical protein UFOVP986_5 [uncultured Caudovirales phage]CAB4191087.1 hypothetical protein UFOVP1219_24 [uncultured Caudovirales phage]CAB4223434.1 hypothetical protein UFOVP1671_73 [uncultured Caudovirales phage]CAB5220514.1 hypothetical protein UFOVP358_34 [uncultured Caudovirales phage]